MTTISLLIEEEGFRDKPYLDTEGIPTFGYGFTYITKEEAEVILQDRVYSIHKQLEDKYGWFNYLGSTRQSIIISMVYQLGLSGFGKFKNMIKALEDKDYDKASIEGLDSKWAKQTSNRAERQMKILKEG